MIKLKHCDKKDKSLKCQIKSIRVDTYTKLLVAVIVIVALIDLQLSYVLAFLDKVQIAESLSTQICITILGTALIYMIRAYFDSRAEHNNITNIQQQVQQDISDKVREILNNSGIPININEDMVDISNPECQDNTNIDQGGNIDG